MSGEGKAAADVARAVSGPETPDTVAVSTTPDNRTVLAMMGAGPALSAMIAAATAALVFIFWPDAVEGQYVSVMTDIVRVMGFVITALCAILGVVVFRLASGALKRVEAKAGPASLTVEGDG